MSTKLVTLLRKRAGGAAFNPASVSGYFADYSADDLSSAPPPWPDRAPGNHPLNSTTSAPTLSPTGIGAKPGVVFDGNNQHLRSASFVLPQPFTVYAVAQHDTAAGTKRLFDGRSVNQATIQATIDAGAANYALYAGAAACTEPNGSADRPDVIAVVFNGASSSLTVGNRAAVTGNPGTGSYDDGFILGAAGNLAAGFGFSGRVGRFVLYSGGHDAATRAIVRRGLVSLNRLVGMEAHCDGDSNTFGLGTSDPVTKSWPARLAAMLGGTSTVVNNGISNYKASDIDPLVQARHGRACTALRPMVLGLMAGTNDIWFGADDTTTYNSLKSCWAKVRANGGKVIAMTVFARGPFDATQEAFRVALNTKIRSDPSLYDALYDVAAIADFANPTSPYFNVDGTHVNDDGSLRIATDLYPYYLALAA